MTIRPGDLVLSLKFPRSGTQWLFLTPRHNRFEDFIAGILYGNELCLVLATYLNKIFVLTEHQQLGWKNSDDFHELN